LEEYSVHLFRADVILLSYYSAECRNKRFSCSYSKTNKYTNVTIVFVHAVHQNCDKFRS